MDQPISAVYIYETREQAQHATQTLQSAGIDMDTLSTATRDLGSDTHEAGFYQAGDQCFSVPGLGPLVVSGPLAAWILAAFAAGTDRGDRSVVGTGLATLGISPDSVQQYELALKTDKYLLVLHGSRNAVATAVGVIGGTTHCSHTVHGEKVFDTVHGANLLVDEALTYQA